MRTLMFLGLSASLMFSSSLLLASEAEVVSKEIDAAKEKENAVSTEKEEKKQGWEGKLSVGANFSMNSSKNVVGVDDGQTTQLGILIGGAAQYRKGSHLLVNEGKLTHGQTKTPAIPVFVKSADSLELQSTYFYSLKSVDWIGPFARARLTTSILPGHLVRADGTVAGVLQEDGSYAKAPNAAVELDDGTALVDYNLTSAFEPLLLKEVVGALAKPIDKGTKLTLGFHIGAGAEEAFADGGYAIADNGDTAEIELKSLESYVSLGAEFEGSAAGTVNEYVNWTAGLNLFQPIITTSDTELSGIDRMNIDVSGKISVKLAKWASLDLVASAKKYPLLVDEWQRQAGFMLSTTFNLL